jgi:phage baseplate assembly protein W
MIGMDAATGKALGGDDHLRQSLGVIISTAIGTRCMRRDFGVADLIDQPMNALGRVRLFGAIATAIARWEPRIRLTRVSFAASADGVGTVHIEGRRTDGLPGNSLARLSIPLRNPA